MTRRVSARIGAWALVCGAGLIPVAASASVCEDERLEALVCDGGGWNIELRSTFASAIDGYQCSTYAQTGPEAVFEFTCPFATDVEVVMANTDCDFDLFVLGAGCTPGSGCTGSDTSAGSGTGLQGLVSFACQPGQTYWVIIEGYDLDYWGACPGTVAYDYGSALVAAFCDERGDGCHDGDDNDGDGDVDCDDDGCTCAEDCAVPGDEDGNGLADCADPACAGAAACCDDDGDGYAAMGGACGGDDCADGDRDRHPGAAEVVGDGIDQDCDGEDDCYVDADRDGIGGTVVTSSATSCGPTAGLSTRDDDCDDTGPNAAQRFPGATEVTGDGIDQDCDGVDDCFRDRDDDGYGDGVARPGPSLDCDAAGGWASVDGDCRDRGTGAASAYPGAPEVCDGLDNDCNGPIDDVPETVTVYRDDDGDGYGLASDTLVVSGCATPAGYGPQAGDCDDADADRNPGAEEVPYDGIDQDCRAGDLNDLDGDGAIGLDAGGPDCHDGDPTVGPGRIERPNGLDDDCDGVVDEATDAHDDDGDGYAEAGGDCDDADAARHPGAVERCSGVDDDCDGTADEGTECFDDDGDGYTELGGDCHDGDAAISPGMPETYGNGLDDDCDGRVDADRVIDADRDGIAGFAGDCDDDDPAISPAAPEVVNGIDDDCDGRVDEGTRAYDDDGDGWTEDQGDCHDGDATIAPDADEVLNHRDDDCDGRVDEVGPWIDADADGYSPGQGDCDDGDREVHPGAPEVGNDVDDDCDGETDEGVVDDGDGVSAAEGDCDDTNPWIGPNAPEVCNGIDDDCDGEIDEGTCIAPDPVVDDVVGCRTVPMPWTLWPLLGVLGWRVRRRRV